MATLDKAAFEAKYGSSGTIFPDNTTGDISEGDMRDFGQDIADSLYNRSVSGSLTFVIVEIGDWNIYVTGGGSGSATKTVAHGLADFKKIRSVNVVVRNDADTNYYFTPTSAIALNYLDSTNINLSSSLDFSGFSTTSYNRGWVTIAYVA